MFLTRPAVEAGEKLRFLTSTLYDKIHLHLRLLYDVLYDIIEAEPITRLIEMETVEVAPLAFMRGRTSTKVWALPAC